MWQDVNSIGRTYNGTIEFNGKRYIQVLQAVPGVSEIM